MFASGAGTNAARIIDYFREHPGIRVVLIVSNKPGAGVLEIAQKEKIPFLVLDRERFYAEDGYIAELLDRDIRLIVLAGFLWKIPVKLVEAFRGKIINIHPALLPLYGGRGMYGRHVHEAVLAAGEKESGITIHYVDEVYDHGDIIFQARCPVAETDDPQQLAKKIRVLEHTHYPRVIENLLKEEV